ncbi:MAG: bifunctional diaminohydroxyphosphoribosylaminopyrimidine deaminase/5-amino-6-(5-phosphoribosylamino)uracil reductase RibD [Clostridium sp.]|nr:bifunctional diaminohydroxyphosphoribosylaminopyrimidine deaminase/5-amino-6-(5-phosphoribosylamino)uracil reductase RibD [Clostridium sp.]
MKEKPTTVITDEIYMRRCLELAANGAGYTATNPMVGSVVVWEGRIIGEGYHERYGGPHAEVNAIGSVSRPDLLKNSTLYVNLEPCSHHGKTPPCADLIIRSGIPEVVVGMTDPFCEVCGKGIGKLRDAGIVVVTGILQEECERLNRVFITYHTKKRPYIRLKWAQTVDGYLDNDRRADQPPTWMTGSVARTWVHRMRGDAAAIMAGTNTILRDDPSLTARESGKPDPIRVVIDRKGRIPRCAKVFDGTAPTWLFTGDPKAYAGSGTVFPIGLRSGIEEMLDSLQQAGIADLFVEGGAELFRTLIEKDLWDEQHIFVSPLFLSDLKGGSGNIARAVKAPAISGRTVRTEDLGPVRYYYTVNK